MTLDKLSQITEVGIKSGITLRNINVEGAYVSGVVTATTLTVTNGFNVNGVVTATSFNGNVVGSINPTSLNVSGVSTFNANVFLGDGDIAYFGDGQDLLIFHNSTDSIIRDNGTGDLYIEGGNRIKLTSPTALETYAVFNQDGASELYYDNVKKLETTSSGVIVSGTSGVGTSLLVNGDARITGILTIGTSSITFNGNDNSVTIGTATTLDSTGFGGSGANLTDINASNLGSGTIPDARFPATLPAVSGANLTGIAAFAAGTLMLFQQTAAPTGWTKQTTHNDKSLRVVSGNASSGGTTAFTSVFASRTPGGSVSVSGSNSGGSIANTTATGSVSGSNSGGGVSGHTLSTSEIPSHTHSYFNNGSQYDNPYNVGGSRYQLYQAATTGATGGNGSHAHGFTNPSWSGSISINAHNHTVTNPSWSGSGSFSGTAMDFAVQYVDLIIASKN